MSRLCACICQQSDRQCVIDVTKTLETKILLYLCNTTLTFQDSIGQSIPSLWWTHTEGCATLLTHQSSRFLQWGDVLDYYKRFTYVQMGKEFNLPRKCHDCLHLCIYIIAQISDLHCFIIIIIIIVAALSLKVLYFVYCISWLYIFLYYTLGILWTAKEFQQRISLHNWEHVSLLCIWQKTLWIWI